jgi:hypothetical protein
MAFGFEFRPLFEEACLPQLAKCLGYRLNDHGIKSSIPKKGRDFPLSRDI